jgi:hypothetical protein
MSLPPRRDRERIVAQVERWRTAFLAGDRVAIDLSRRALKKLGITLRRDEPGPYPGSASPAP